MLIILLVQSHERKILREQYSFIRHAPAQTIPDSSIQLFPNNTAEKDKIEKYLTVEAALLGISDNISWYYKDLTKQFNITFDSDRSWLPASIIKAFVMLEAFRQKRIGLINFDQRVIISKQNVVPTELEAYDFPPLREGTRATIRELVDAMIDQSDNTAYNTLLDILDRRNINVTLHLLGFNDTAVGEKINLDDDQYQLDLQIPGRQPNRTTVKDFAKLFDMLYNKQVPNADEMLAVFKRQKVNYMIPALLPANTVVAHKTGEYSPYYHDGGVIYKPGEPFILTVFTNSNDPSVVSQIAKTAYYQDTSSISLNSVRSNIPNDKPHMIKYLTAMDTHSGNVLGVKIKKHYVRMTAADLGISNVDLAIGQNDTRIVRETAIVPGNILYIFKLLAEKIQLYQAKTNSEKVLILLQHAFNRIAEIKTVLRKGDVDNLSYLLNSCTNDIASALRIIKTTDVPDAEIIYIKQINDLLFSILGESTKYVANNKMSKFIDQVYAGYQDTQKEIAPLIKNADLENPFHHEPILGTVKTISGTQLMLALKDGSLKKVLLFATTQLRGFHSVQTENISTLHAGSRVAIDGEYTENGDIVPIFILKDIPADFPQQIEGIVTQINTDEGTMTIQDTSFVMRKIFITDTTTLESRDTQVNLEGITAGSQIIAFGETKNRFDILATTITIVANGSGVNEQIKILPPQNTQNSTY